MKTTTELLSIVTTLVRCISASTENHNLINDASRQRGEGGKEKESLHELSPNGSMELLQSIHEELRTGCNIIIFRKRQRIRMRVRGCFFRGPWTSGTRSWRHCPLLSTPLIFLFPFQFNHQPLIIYSFFTAWQTLLQVRGKTTESTRTTWK